MNIINGDTYLTICNDSGTFSLVAGRFFTLLYNADVYHNGHTYRVVMSDYGTFKVYVPHRGFSRKVKTDGPTGRSVIARCLFPYA